MGSTKRRLIVLRGLPGSGKSTKALAYVDEDTTARCRVNRDQLRTMFHGRRLGHGRQEGIVTDVQMFAVRTAFDNGYSVVLVDDTNLPDASVNRFERLAGDLGAVFEVWDLRDVDIETCIQRDRLRATPVGEAVIRQMHANHIAHPSKATRIRRVRTAANA